MPSEQLNGNFLRWLGQFTHWMLSQSPTLNSKSLFYSWYLWITAVWFAGLFAFWMQVTFHEFWLNRGGLPWLNGKSWPDNQVQCSVSVPSWTLHKNATSNHKDFAMMFFRRSFHTGCWSIKLAQQKAGRLLGFRRVKKVKKISQSRSSTLRSPLPLHLLRKEPWWLKFILYCEMCRCCLLWLSMVKKWFCLYFGAIYSKYEFLWLGIFQLFNEIWCIYEEGENDFASLSATAEAAGDVEASGICESAEQPHFCVDSRFLCACGSEADVQFKSSTFSIHLRPTFASLSIHHLFFFLCGNLRSRCN